jgi:hypothetical protein
MASWRDRPNRGGCVPSSSGETIVHARGAVTKICCQASILTHVRSEQIWNDDNGQHRLTIRIKRLIVAEADGLVLGLASAIGAAAITIWLWRGYSLIF